MRVNSPHCVAVFESGRSWIKFWSHGHQLLTAVQVKLQDLGAWAEGFEPKASRLLVMALPPQPSGATPAVMPDESAAELNTGINLDLEFPPLLAASEPQDGEKSRK